MARTFIRLLPLLSGFFTFTQAFGSVFPFNDLNRQDDLGRKTEVDKQKFHEILNQIERIYVPVMRNHGAEFSFQPDWDNHTVNGSATRNGKNWAVVMSGALARLPGIKPEYFTFMACHELGHHVAGFPFYPDTGWVSAESEADYYATRVCLRKVWGREKEENARYAQQALPIVKELCADAWKLEEDRNLCARIVTVSDGYAKFYAKIRGWYKPEIETPEPYKVYRTFFTHAKAQAKLDIYVAGATCNAPFNDNIIPGLRFKQDPIAAERDAARYSCHEASGYSEGVRPKSYFKPALDFAPAKLQSMSVNGAQQGVTALNPGQEATVEATLVNNSESVTTKVSGFLQSLTPGVSVVAASSDFADIAPKQTSTNGTKFRVKLDENFQCGAPFELRLAVNTSNAGGATFRKSYIAGSLNSSFVGRSDESVSIPDYGDAIATLNSNYDGPVRRVKVRGHLKHHYGRDLKIFLIAPDGTRHFVTSPAETEDDHIDINEEFDMPVASAKGQWKLHFIDDQIYTVGELYWWELETLSASCN